MKERFLSYAQEYEDLIVCHALKDVQNDFYVDVGANDPWALSVTKALYERGWSRINRYYCEGKKAYIKKLNGCIKWTF